MDTKTNMAVKSTVNEIVKDTVYNEIVNLIGWDYNNYLEDSQNLETLYKNNANSTLRGANNIILAVIKPKHLIKLYIWYLTKMVEYDDIPEPLYINLVCKITELEVLISGGNSNGSD